MVHVNLRAPGPPEEATKGSSRNFPFWPGGFDAQESPAGLGEAAEGGAAAAAEGILAELEGGGAGLKTCPPGFARGVDFGRLGGSEGRKAADGRGEAAVLNLASALLADEDSLGVWDSEEKGAKEGEETRGVSDLEFGYFQFYFSDIFRSNL